jgi:hypothetical protein
VLQPILCHYFQVVVEDPFSVAQQLEEYKEHCIESQRNKQTIFPPIIGHEKGINAQLPSVYKQQARSIKG